jgi:hypothetical protein
MKKASASLAILCAMSSLAGSVEAQSRAASIGASVAQRPVVVDQASRSWINQVLTHEIITADVGTIKSTLPLYLFGTRIQISQTGNGIPLPGSGAMSYIDFAPGTNDMGVVDRAFDVPVTERGLSQVAMAAIGAMSGGLFSAYAVRFKVNDLNAELNYQNFVPFLGDGVFGLDLYLESESPTVKCEANTLSMLPFGFPIPVGWRDDTCPDAQFQNTVLHVSLVPGVDAKGQIVINDAQVVLDANIDVSPIEFLDDYIHLKQELRDGFANQLRDKFLEPEFRAFFAGIIKGLLEQKRGRPLGTVYSVWVDPQGINADVSR